VEGESGSSMEGEVKGMVEVESGSSREV